MHVCPSQRYGIRRPSSSLTLHPFPPLCFFPLQHRHSIPSLLCFFPLPRTHSFPLSLSLPLSLSPLILTPKYSFVGRGTTTDLILCLGYGEDSGSVFQLRRVRDNSSARRATTAASRRPLQVSRTWRRFQHYGHGWQLTLKLQLKWLRLRLQWV